MNRTYFYTETAFHHEGDINYLKELVKSTYDAGCSGVKFQVLTEASDFISTKHSAFKELKEYCLSEEEWQSVFSYTQKLGLDIIMMPLNLGAFNLLKKNNVKFLDIHSVSFYDEGLINKVKESGIDVILGVGGRTLEEINEKRVFFGEQLKVLMVGFQSFPSELKNVKIGKIKYLREQYPGLEIGYADHSSFKDEFSILSNEYARILGATYFEKHITLNEGEDRVDAASAINSDNIRIMKDKITFIDDYIVTGYEESFTFDDTERIYRERQLICVANEFISANTKIKAKNLTLKMVDVKEKCFNRIEDLIGEVVLVDIQIDAPIKKEDIKL